MQILTLAEKNAFSGALGEGVQGEGPALCQRHAHYPLACMHAGPKLLKRALNYQAGLQPAHALLSTASTRTTTKEVS